MRFIQYSFLVFIFLGCRPNGPELKSDLKEYNQDSLQRPVSLFKPPPSYYSGCTFIEFENELFFHNKGKSFDGNFNKAPFIDLRNKDIILIEDISLKKIVDSIIENQKGIKLKICEQVSIDNSFSKRNSDKLMIKLSRKNGFAWHKREITAEETGAVCRFGLSESDYCDFANLFRRFSFRSNSSDSYYYYSYPYTFYDSIYYVPHLISKYREPDYFHFDLKNRKSKSNYQFMGDKSFRINGKRYSIYKFSNYPDNKTSDGDGNFFFSPEVGLLILYSVNWGSFEKLIDCPSISQEEVDFLTYKIISDSIFLRGYDL